MNLKKEWAKTQRAMALDREKNRRGDTENGFLMVWPEEEDIVPPSPAAARRPCRPRKNHVEETCMEEKVESGNESTRGEIVGSNNRTINVLYEGSGDQTGEIAAPQRSPVFMTGLSTDEEDCVLARVRDFNSSRRTVSTQTDDVLIFKNKDELLAAYDPKGRSLKDVCETLASQSNQITEICSTLQALKYNDTLNEILTVIRGLREDRDVSRLLQMGILSDLNSESRTEESSAEENTYMYD